MTDIDPKALEHACQCAGRSVHHFDRMALDLPLRASIVAHARAIEQHEAFKCEVSDAVEKALYQMRANQLLQAQVGLTLTPFIIAKPDPLEEVMEELVNYSRIIDAASIRAAIEKRGGKIVWGEGG